MLLFYRTVELKAFALYTAEVCVFVCVCAVGSEDMWGCGRNRNCISVYKLKILIFHHKEIKQIIMGIITQKLKLLYKLRCSDEQRYLEEW